MAARILVAEDDPEMLRIIAEALTLDGHAVEVLQDGGRLFAELACAPLAGPRIDLIVSDIRMPTASAIEILEALRAARRPLPPVILMTAFGDDETRAKAARLGAVLFDKPFEVSDLRAAVNRLLEFDALTQARREAPTLEKPEDA